MRIPAKLALLMSDKELKAIVSSKRIEYIIECYNNEELIKIRERVNGLWKKIN